jgi:hypothetical protein
MATATAELALQRACFSASSAQKSASWSLGALMCSAATMALLAIAWIPPGVLATVTRCAMV